MLSLFLNVACTRQDVARWLEISASNGDPNAQIQLGKMYLEGDGVRRNAAIGNMWLQRAAAQHERVRQTAPMGQVGRTSAPTLRGAGPLGGWKIRRGYIRTTWWFNDNGAYAYERSGPERQEEEQGTYLTRGDRLIISPNGKPQRTLQRWIGSEATALQGEPILWLVDEYGRREMYYLQR
jgi:hypothetical protein